MDLNQLRYFFVIAKYQNISLAAKELLVAQPALSQSIKNLETALGVKLFIRSGKRISLSPCGVELQRRLQSVLPQIDSLPAILQEIERLYNTTIKVCIKVASAYFIPIIMTHFAAQNPDVLLQFYSNDQAPCDFIISSAPPDSHMCGMQILEGQEIFLLAPANSDLAEKDSIALTDVKDHHFILQTSNHNIRNTIDSYFAQAGFQPNVSVECDFPFMIPELVRRDYGIAVLPSDVAVDSPDLKLLRITSPVCKRDLYLMWHKDAPFTAGMTMFHRFFQGYFGDKTV